MNAEQKVAYEWAKNQEYPSVAARYAKTLAGLIESLTAQLTASQQETRAAVCDLKISAFCQTCRKRCSLTESLSRRSFGACKHYEWRGDVGRKD